MARSLTFNSCVKDATGVNPTVVFVKYTTGWLEPIAARDKARKKAPHRPPNAPAPPKKGRVARTELKMPVAVATYTNPIAKQ